VWWLTDVMNRYYELTASLRDRLAARGRPDAAAELLSAERAASTSGEAISNIAAVLDRLDESGTLAAAGASELAKEIAELGQRAWDAANGGEVEDPHNR
jgi:hypothetical protein